MASVPNIPSAFSVLVRLANEEAIDRGNVLRVGLEHRAFLVDEQLIHLGFDFLRASRDSKLVRDRIHKAL